MAVTRMYIAGFILPAVCLIATGYVNCSASFAVFLIIAAVGFSGISLAGFMVNHLDLAPLYAGPYMSHLSLINLSSISKHFV